MANYYGKVFRGTLNIFMFWLFPENGKWKISERTVNRALIVHTTLYNPALTHTHTKKKKKIAMYQNYPLALNRLYF